MSEEFAHLLVQFPLVGIFVGFVIYRDRMVARYLEGRNSKAEAAQAKVAEALNQVAIQLGENEKILERIRERVGD